MLSQELADRDEQLIRQRERVLTGVEHEAWIEVVALRVTVDVANVSGILPSAIQLDSRQQHVIAARWAAWWLTWAITETSYMHLGDLFMRHHTTIMNGLSKAIVEGSRSRAVVLEVLRLYEKSEVRS